MTTSDRPGVACVPQWLLVTGQPGCGKTTAVKKMVERLQANGKHLRGFYTDEVLDSNTKTRIGFDVVSLPDGKRGILSRKAGHGLSTKHKTGQYFVDVASFEKIALPSLATKTSRKRKMAEIGGNNDDGIILVLDEIGRMELHSTAFSERVRELLDENCRLVGAITAPIYGHRVPFCDEVTERKGVEVHKLTKKTRDDVLLDLFRFLKERGWLDDKKKMK